MLSPVLAGREDATKTSSSTTRPGTRAHGVTLHKGKRVVHVDRAARRVVAADGTTADIRQAPDRDRLRSRSSCRSRARICPASSPSAISTTSRQMLARRSARRPRRRRRRRPPRARGRGGLERRGMDVTVAPSDADPDGAPARPGAGYLLEQAIAARGIEVITRANTHAILGEERVTGVAPRRRPRDRGRPRRDGGRHPARTPRSPRPSGSRSIAASSSTTA